MSQKISSSTIEQSDAAQTSAKSAQKSIQSNLKRVDAEAALDAQVRAKIARVKLQVEEWKKSKLND